MHGIDGGWLDKLRRSLPPTLHTPILVTSLFYPLDIYSIYRSFFFQRLVLAHEDCVDSGVSIWIGYYLYTIQ